VAESSRSIRCGNSHIFAVSSDASDSAIVIQHANEHKILLPFDAEILKKFLSIDSSTFIALGSSGTIIAVNIDGNILARHERHSNPAQEIRDLLLAEESNCLIAWGHNFVSLLSVRDLKVLRSCKTNSKIKSILQSVETVQCRLLPDGRLLCFSLLHEQTASGSNAIGTTISIFDEDGTVVERQDSDQIPGTSFSVYWPYGAPDRNPLRHLSPCGRWLLRYHSATVEIYGNWPSFVQRLFWRLCS
jgi:hypothetical protein